LRVFALRLRALASLLPALERRRIASLKAQDHADFQSGLQQGFALGETGFRSVCTAAIWGRPRPLCADFVAEVAEEGGQLRPCAELKP
jgi:hypothetical protein